MIHNSSSLLLTCRSLRITYSASLLLWYSSCAVCTSDYTHSACTPQWSGFLFSIHKQCQTKSNLQMTSVVQAYANRIIHLASAMFSAYSDGQMTDHVTLFLHKQLNTACFNAPSIGSAVGDSFLTS